MIVSTEENVVASLDLRHGEICKKLHIISLVLLHSLLHSLRGLMQFGGMFLGQRMLSMVLTLPWENVGIIFITCGVHLFQDVPCVLKIGLGGANVVSSLKEMIFQTDIFKIRCKRSKNRFRRPTKH